MKKKMNILAVDDNPKNLTLLKGILKDLYVNIITAESGNEALSKIIDHDFALILMDVMMPEMDGFEAVQMIRGMEKGKYIPIIFITAVSSQKKNIYKGYDTGAVDYIIKPIDKDILKSKVNIFLELSEQRIIIEDQKKKLQSENKKLKEAFTRINFLHGFIRVCVKCKKIHNDDGDWDSFENYVLKYSDAKFSHGYCPSCYKNEVKVLESTKKMKE